MRNGISSIQEWQMKMEQKNHKWSTIPRSSRDGLGDKILRSLPSNNLVIKLLSFSETLKSIKYCQVWRKYNTLQNPYGVHVCGIHFDRLPEEVKFEIGRYSYSSSPINIHHYTKKEKISIGSFVSIGLNLKIITTGQHNQSLLSTSQFITKDKYFSRGDVFIGNDVWIGDDVTIIGGVNLGDGSVVGTKALVNKDLEPYGIYGGVPAKLLGYRFEEELIGKLKTLKWWDKPYEELVKIIDEFGIEDIHKLIPSMKEI